ncbi:hypothetical protein AS026_37950 [Rhizobium altiplani]|uniref:Uncharacterized protein n=1 Tax=Rhizobium altiplani TaxID=1864509 RepID=A0A120FNB1_9HYPH|nr:hypothetical protein AS026_37950 [Rhizobium altiplani]
MLSTMALAISLHTIDWQGRGVAMNSRVDIAEWVIARWKARGIRIDQDPGFMNLVALWTGGTIDSDEMRRRYAALQRERRHRSDVER